MRSRARASRGGEARFVRLDGELRVPVGVVEVVEGEGVEVRAALAKGEEDHGDRKSPVAKVVLAPDLPAQPLVHARQRVADDRRPKVPHVELLGDVDAAQVDHDGVLRGHRLDGERRRIHRFEPGRERLGPQPDVDEARARDLQRKRDVAQARLRRVDDALRQLARVAACALRQPERRVALVVAELGVLRGTDPGIDRGDIRDAQGGADRGPKRLLQLRDQVGHGSENRGGRLGGWAMIDATTRRRDDVTIPASDALPRPGTWRPFLP
ncbi:MAG: hypothetical protein U0575_05590 [Phycisphaerales bacterium]